MDVLTGAGEVVTTKPGRPTSSTPSPTPTARSATRPGCASSSSGSRRTSRCGTSASPTPPRSPRRSRAIVAERAWDGRARRRPRRRGVRPRRALPHPRPVDRRARADQRLHRPAGLLPLAAAAAHRPAHRARLPVALGHRLVLVLAGLRRPAPRRAPAVAAAAAPLRRLLAARRAGPPLRHRRPARPPGRAAAGGAGRAGRRGAGGPARRSSWRWFDAEVGMRPVWLCPLRLRRTDAERPWPTYPLTSGDDVRQRRLLGQRARRPDAPTAPRNRAIEAKVARARRPQVALLRGVLRPRRPSTGSTTGQPGARSRALRPRRTADEPLRQGGEETMTTRTDTRRMPIGDAVDRLARRDAGAVHGVRRQQRRARRTRRSGCTCATERGLAYLMTAPGDLGLARAYVSGTSSVTGVDPATPTTCSCCSRTTRGSGVPAPSEAVAHRRGLGLSHLRPPPRRRRSTCPAGAARWRGCGTP